MLGVAFQEETFDGRKYKRLVPVVVYNETSGSVINNYI